MEVVFKQLETDAGKDFDQAAHGGIELLQAAWGVIMSILVKCGDV